MWLELSQWKSPQLSSGHLNKSTIYLSHDSCFGQFQRISRFRATHTCSRSLKHEWSDSSMAHPGTHSPRLWVWLLLVVVSRTAEPVCGVWPLPQQIHQSPDRYSLSPQLFSFTYGKDSAAQTGCSVLDAAFKRYFSIIFPDFTKGPGWFMPENEWNKCTSV